MRSSCCEQPVCAPPSYPAMKDLATCDPPLPSTPTQPNRAVLAPQSSRPLRLLGSRRVAWSMRRPVPPSVPQTNHFDPQAPANHPTDRGRANANPFPAPSRRATLTPTQPNKPYPSAQRTIFCRSQSFGRRCGSQCGCCTLSPCNSVAWISFGAALRCSSLSLDNALVSLWIAFGRVIWT